MSETQQSHPHEQPEREPSSPPDQVDENIGGVRKTVRRLTGEPDGECCAYLQQRIAWEIPQNLDGIDTWRIETFMHEQGYPPIPYIIVDPDQLDSINRIFLETVGYTFMEKLEDNEAGNYNPSLHLCIIWRRPEVEEKNSPFWTEQVIVHELAHASAAKLIAVTEHSQRMGTYNVTKDKGSFLEEAFAESQAMEYARRFQSPSMREQLCAELGIDPSQFASSTLVNGRTPQGQSYRFLPAAAYFTPEGPVGATPSAMAATVWKLLEERHPELSGWIRESRSDPNALRRIRNLLNEHYPGLWKTMRQTPYKKEAYAATQEKLLRIMGVD